MHEGNKPPQSLAVREKIVDDEHAVARRQILLLDKNGVDVAVGVTLHLCGVAIRRYVGSFRLFSKKHRGVEVSCRIASDRDARCFDGHEFCDVAVREKRVDLLSDLLKKAVIDKMIQKPAYFQHLARKDFPVGKDAILQKFHPRIRSELLAPWEYDIIFPFPTLRSL